jgi:transcriptional regulator with XRE-family HTH domain
VRVPVDGGTGSAPQAASRGTTLGVVDPKSEIREFLTSRRAKVTPERAGLTSYGARRVPGLRRSEVATLAGVSIEYYTRIERGNLTGVSESVLEALARALRLDEAERAHLLDLARAAGPTSPSRRRRSRKPGVRSDVQWTIDAMTRAAAFVFNGRLEILAANQLGRALFSELYVNPARPVSTPRFVFLDPCAHEFYADWDRAAGETVAMLRAEAARDPDDRDLSDLVGELSTKSDAFRTLWAAHNVRLHNTGVKHLHHPVVGDITLNYNGLELAADPGLTIFVYTAEPGSKSAESLNLLASWAATLEPGEPVQAPIRLEGQ